MQDTNHAPLPENPLVRPPFLYRQQIESEDREKKQIGPEDRKKKLELEDNKTIKYYRIF